MTQNDTPKKPPMSITVSVNGQDREVFMSFALLNHLAALIEDITHLPLVQVDPRVREIFLTEMLHVRSKGGRVVEKAELDELDISLDDVQALLDFASEHVLDFTLGAVERATALQNRNQARLLSLKSSQAGLEVSASKNSAA